MDSIKDGNETDVDCGGSCTTKCADGKHCSQGTDCVNGSCAGGVCISCMDGLKDGTETDVDCGGPCTTKCAFGKGCAIDTDCATGFCVSGKCDALTLASGQSGPEGVALDLGNVYWVNYGSGGMTNGSVMKVVKTGGTPAALVNPATNPNSIAYSPVWGLFYLSAPGVSYEQTTGGTPTVISNSGAYGQIAIDNTFAYFTIDCGGGCGSVAKVPLAGGTTTTLISYAMNSNVNVPSGIAVDANNIYWANSIGNAVMKMPVGGGAGTVLASGQTGAGYLVIDLNNVYFVTGGTIAKVPIGGGSTTVIVPSSVTGTLITDPLSSYIYYGSGGNLKKVLSTGGTITTLATSAGGTIWGIAVDNTYVYWSNVTDGTVKKIIK
jgi:hypothetical protein